jgi:hypothetical protein
MNQQSDELDRILLSEQSLLPSSGFASSVMDAIAKEAATPAPIPFPWKRVLPGFAALLVGIFFLFRLLSETLAGIASQPAPTMNLLGWLQSNSAAAVVLRTQAAPALFAVAVSLLSFLICRRFAVGRPTE